MSLRQLYEISTSSLNPTGAVNLLPGGAGVQVTGKQITPGISAPSLEPEKYEVLDVTAPTLITGQSVNALGTPAIQGKLVVLDPLNGAFGAVWSLNKTVKQILPKGTYGIVDAPGQANETGGCVSSVNGNISNGSRALIVTEGPVKAYVQGTVGNTAISAGMTLAADGAGNLTYAGASAGAGTILGILCDASVASSVSIPVLSNVYLASA